MKQLIHLLNTRYGYAVPEKTWLSLFSIAEEINLQKNEYLLRAGCRNSDLIMVKEGILRTVYINGARDRTVRFSFAGTLCSSRYTFLKNEPSICDIITVTPSTVLKIPRDNFIDLTRKDHSFALWALNYAWTEQYLEDVRESTFLNGSVEERYRQTMCCRPELVRNVPSSVLASYLGCTAEHLCRVKVKLLYK